VQWGNPVDFVVRVPCHFHATASWPWGIPALTQPALAGAVSCKDANSAHLVGFVAERKKD